MWRIEKTCASEIRPVDLARVFAVSRISHGSFAWEFRTMECRHCGEPVPDSRDVFCCSKCMRVWHNLQTTIARRLGARMIRQAAGAPPMPADTVTGHKPARSVVPSILPRISDEHRLNRLSGRSHVPGAADTPIPAPSTGRIVEKRGR